ncbi:MAG: zinc metallopeptidase [Isosphaerales bacterium]
MFLNIDYVLFALPGILLSLWAQARISSAYSAGSRIPAASGRTGALAAAIVMEAGGVSGVRIEQVTGELSDHYDPRHKVLRLSGGVYAGRSLAAMGVAAHEAGHAIQDASGYPGLVVRNLVVPLASIGSMFFWLPIMAGLLLEMGGLILVGIILFSLTVVFQLINLPVEFNASRRGRELLQSTCLVSADEDQVVAKVLNAAAWTYVAATLTSLLTLLYYLVQFGLLGRRRRGN